MSPRPAGFFDERGSDGAGRLQWLAVKRELTRTEQWQADQHARENSLGYRQLSEMHSLGQDLLERSKDLVSGCVMTGEATTNCTCTLKNSRRPPTRFHHSRTIQKGRMSQAEMIHLLEGYHERFA